MITYEQLKKLGFKSVLRPRNAFSGHISPYYRRGLEIKLNNGYWIRVQRKTVMVSNCDSFLHDNTVTFFRIDPITGEAMTIKNFKKLIEGINTTYVC